MSFKIGLQNNFEIAGVELVAPGRFSRLPSVAGRLDFAVVECQARLGRAFVAGDDLGGEIDRCG